MVGKSRSVSVVLAYLMQTRSLTLKQAFDHVQKTRQNVRPNDTFLKELQAFEAQLFPNLEAPTLLHSDLPEMKDPATMKRKTDAIVAEFLDQHLSDAVLLTCLGDLDPVKKNFQKFQAAVRRHLKEAHPKELELLKEQTKLGDKGLTKSLKPLLASFFEKQ